MRIAVIGAGFAGLATAWHLLDLGAAEVVLFDSQGIGGGASGIAAGLLHPYVGEEGKRSRLATEALEEAYALLLNVASNSSEQIVTEGILRLAASESQKILFRSHCVSYQDVEEVEEGVFWIHSGRVVDCPAYLKGLFEQIALKGGSLVKKHIDDLAELKEFDQIVIAAGSGSFLAEQAVSSQVSLLKGQVLVCEAAPTVELPECSLISKGYLAFLKGSRRCYVGSTYERQHINAIPDLTATCLKLLPQLEAFFPAARELIIEGCRAAVRVIRKGHYFPLLVKQENRVWVLTALGSRGLLYHGLLAKVLAKAILQEDASLLDEVCI